MIGFIEQTWEPQKYLKNVKDMIAEFNKSKLLSSKQKKSNSEQKIDKKYQEDDQLMEKKKEQQHSQKEQDTNENEEKKVRFQENDINESQKKMIKKTGVKKKNKSKISKQNQKSGPYIQLYLRKKCVKCSKKLYCLSCIDERKKELKKNQQQKVKKPIKKSELGSFQYGDSAEKVIEAIHHVSYGILYKVQWKPRGLDQNNFVPQQRYISSEELKEFDLIRNSNDNNLLIVDFYENILNLQFEKKKNLNQTQPNIQQRKNEDDFIKLKNQEYQYTSYPAQQNDIDDQQLYSNDMEEGI